VDSFKTQVQQTFSDFLRAYPGGAPIVCVCHNDVDGLSSAVLLHHGLHSQCPVDILPTGKAETQYSPRIQQLLTAKSHAALIACDLSPRPEPVLPGIPELVIDHHRPELVAPGTTLITGYGQKPVPTSGILAYWCGSAVADLSRCRWMAALSAIADMADLKEFPDVADSLSEKELSALRRAAALLNAPRRCSHGDATPALRLLLRAQSVSDLLERSDPDHQLLVRARLEVNQALTDAKRAAPKFSGAVALVRVNSSCQVHPVIAQIWRTRLPKYIVIAANYGYRPGYVHFSARTANGRNLIEFLNEHRPSSAGDEFARGHDQATGGSVTTAAWNKLLEGLGFGAEVMAEAAA
jgi:single-stranded-DNA-specific exonuclease